jgi:hypothetical protein
LDFSTDPDTKPWFARELYKLFKEAGLVEVRVAEAAAFVLTDFSLANQVFGLEDNVATVEKAGVISSAEAKNWIDYLEQADQAGHFFSSVTSFTVVGQKP